MVGGFEESFASWGEAIQSSPGIFTQSEGTAMFLGPRERGGRGQGRLKAKLATIHSKISGELSTPVGKIARIWAYSADSPQNILICKCLNIIHHGAKRPDPDLLKMIMNRSLSQGACATCTAII